MAGNTRFLCFLGVSLVVLLPVSAFAQDVTLISPNGLQRWEAGSSLSILFETLDVTDVRIEISDDDGASWSDVIASAPAAAGAYLWTVPAAPGDFHRIRVSDVGGSGASDQSDEPFSIVPEITGDEFDAVFFHDSPTPTYYDPSWSFVTAPSTLVQHGVKIPVSADRSLVGNRSLSLAWTSREGGGWGAAVASPGWVGHDATQRDSLVFSAYSDQAIAQADLPEIYLEDLSNAKTDHLPLSDFTGGIAAGAWDRIAIPIQAFLDAPGSADPTRIKTIFFGQSAADGAAHHMYLDDVRMTGGDIVTGDDVPLIVVLGSSTAAGTGASHPDSSWVGRYRDFVTGEFESAQVVNLAVGGYTTYHLMPDGSVPPLGRPSPSTGHNITRALAYRPWAIIVNLPSNDVAYGYTIEEQLANYDVITAASASAAVPIWISTTQPRNLGDAQRALQQTMADTTFALYGDHAIDFWNGVAAPDGTILPAYNSGDGIHLNDSGHALLYQRVVDAGVWEDVTSTEVEQHGADTPPRSSRLRLYRNTPNPFNPSTDIVFGLDSPAQVTLDVFDLRGQRVRRLVEGWMPAATSRVRWNGRNDAGHSVPSGTYLYQVRAAGVSRSKSMVLLR